MKKLSTKLKDFKKEFIKGRKVSGDEKDTESVKFFSTIDKLVKHAEEEEKFTKAVQSELEFYTKENQKISKENSLLKDEIQALKNQDQEIPENNEEITEVIEPELSYKTSSKKVTILYGNDEKVIKKRIYKNAYKFCGISEEEPEKKEGQRVEKQKIGEKEFYALYKKQ